MKKIQKYTAYLFLFLIAFTPFVAGAQTGGGGGAPGLKEFVNERVLGLVNPIILVLSGLAIIAFLWGLTKFIYAAGSSDGRTEGKSVMVWGIVALFVLFSFWGIVQFLQRSFFGSDNVPLPLEPL